MGALSRFLPALSMLGLLALSIQCVSGATLLSEGFEGPGFENPGWTKVGNPDEDYSATALDGLQSLRCLPGQQISRPFSFSDSFYFYCKMRLIALPAFQGIMLWRNTDENAVAELYFNNGSVELIHGHVIITSGGLFVADTTYDVWIEWSRGTGSDGTMKLFVATDGIKPQEPQVNITNGNGGAIDRFILGPENFQRGDVVFDLVMVADAPIGDNPGGGQNHPPSISRISNQTITEGTSTGPIPFVVNDAETAPASLLVTATSSNPTLAPDANIFLGGAGANRTIEVTPAANQNGVATIDVAVSDGQATTSTSFTVVVEPATGPTYLFSEGFEGPGFENAGWTKIGGGNADFTALALHGSQSLQCVGGQRILRAFTFGDSFYFYFKTRFIALPAFQSLIDWRNSGLNAVAQMYINGGTVNMVHGNVVATSSTVLLVNTTYDIWIEWTKGTGADGTLKLFISTDGIKPQSPEVNITIGTGDAVSRIDLGPQNSGNVIFDHLLVDDVPIGSTFGGNHNENPTISDIADGIIPANSSFGPISFVISDAETPAEVLVLSASSSNPALVPEENILFGGSGSNRTVTVTPIADQSGSANITVTVSDGALAASDSFALLIGGVLTVNVDNATRLYGSPNPRFTGALSGVEEGDNITATYATDSSSADPVGSYTIFPVLSDPDGKLNKYAVVTNLGTLTVTPGPLDVLADDALQTYGATSPPLTGTIIGIQNGDNISATYTSTATFSSPVGPYSITPLLLDPQNKLTNYDLSVHNGTLTITPAPLIGRADDKSRLQGHTNPIFTVTYGGFVNGEDRSILTGTLVTVSPADVNSPPGIYPISASGQTAPNYTITYQDGRLTVTAAELVIQIDNAARLYGSANPPFTGTISGLQSGDNITATYTTTATPASPIGSYSITPLLNDPDQRLSNYDLTVRNGTLTISPALLTATPLDTSRAYGQTNPLSALTYTGFVNGEDASIVSGPLSVSSPADTNSPPGTYPMILSGQTAPNYTIAYKEGTLIVTGAVLLIEIDDLARAYATENPPLTGTINGIVNGDNITATLTTSATLASPAGVYPITALLGDPDGKLGNYNLVVRNGTLTVTPAALTISADDKIREFATPNPPLTGTVAGAQDADNITASYATAADILSLPGNYPIRPQLVDPDNKEGNYRTTTQEGTLTVTLVPEIPPEGLIPLDVNVDDKIRTYRAADPPFTGTLTGLQSGDNITVNYTSVVNRSSPAGVYAIKALLDDPDGKLAKYKLTTHNGTLTITPAALDLSIDDKSRPYGAANLQLTGTVVGLNYSDNIAVSFTTPATATSPPGSYPITAIINDPNGDLANYRLKVRNGLLIVKAPAAFSLASLAFANNRVHLIGHGDANVTYTIQASTDLIEWSVIGAAQSDATGQFEFDRTEESNSEVRFFRAFLP